MILLGIIGSWLRRGGRRGDGEGEAELRAAYAAHGAELFRLALRSLGDRGLAEEIVQETFLRAWRHKERFDADRGSRRTWLFSIARYLIIDAARARAVRPAGPLADAERGREGDPANEDPTEEALRSMQVEEALDRIGEEHRKVIVEVHLRDRPYAEVARELGVPAGTLRSRMYYGLKALRLALEEAGHTHE